MTAAAVQELLAAVDLGIIRRFQQMLTATDSTRIPPSCSVHTVAALLKQVLRELSDSLIPSYMAPRLLDIMRAKVQINLL